MYNTIKHILILLLYVALAEYLCVGIYAKNNNNKKTIRRYYI